MFFLEDLVILSSVFLFIFFLFFGVRDFALNFPFKTLYPILHHHFFYLLCLLSFVQGAFI